MKTGMIKRKRVAEVGDWAEKWRVLVSKPSVSKTWTVFW